MNGKYLFRSTTLTAHPYGQAMRDILNAALLAADPYAAVRRWVSITNQTLRIGDEAFPLDQIGAIKVIAVGKAAPAMAEAVWNALGDRITAGLIVTKYAPERDIPGFETIIGGHPVPDRQSLQAGKRALELLAGSKPNGLVIFLISGGGSALITQPVAGVALEDLQTATSACLACGARIDEINILRRSLDLVKGGGLARAAMPARMVSLLLSDVIGSPLEAIASGPTVSNPTSSEQALAVIKKYDLTSKLPISILTALKKAAEPDNATYGPAILIGSGPISAEAARVAAKELGFSSQVVSINLQGEASEVGKAFALRRLEDVHRPFCLIASGETTVTLAENPGVGGRNLECALGAVEALDGARDTVLITLATDGDDGPSGAAGAVVSGDTAGRARQLGLDARAALTRHSSLAFFDGLGDTLVTGPTGTNVNDLIFLFVF